MGFSVGCFGYGGTVALVEQYREELELSGIQLKTCHEYANATVSYNKETIFSFIDSCDIIILPCRTKLQPAKSVNRLALALSRRKACVVSPLDSYLRYFKDGEHVLIADTKEQWLEAIFKLRDDVELRERLAINGCSQNLQLHPSNQVTNLFAELSYHNMFLTGWPQDTFVQIIIPHYAPRLDYLELTVKAAIESWGPARDILIVSSSSVDPRHLKFQSTKDTQVRFIYENEKKTFSQANNIGIQNAHPQTTHFLLLNDDTILAHRALGSMVRLLSKTDDFILNPWSNCDKGWLHNDILTLDNKDLHPNMRIEDFTSEELTKLANMDGSDHTGVQNAPFCAFYCTMLPKKIIDTVGTLNTIFKNGGEDLDYCERAKRYGFNTHWTKEAFCFHFGGKTRAVSENENFQQHHKEDAENNLRAKKRWQIGKKRIAIWTGPAWETWDIDSYKTTGIGGSETCAARLAQTAAAEGHSVTMYGAHEFKEQYGVQLMPWDWFRPEEEYFDLFIASRTLNCIDQRLKAKKVLVWIHDIWLMSGKEISEYHRSRVDKFVCLSPWHTDFVSNHHQLPKDKITIIPNGINVELFETPNLDTKKYGKLIYSSSPDRGLDNLIYMLIFAKDRVPELHLDVYYGFHNYESAVKSRNNTEEVRKFNELKEIIERHSNFVNMHGRVSQIELAKKWAEAYAWVQPTVFTETFCCLPNTKISMSDGTYKQIIDIKENDEVKTHAGIGKVLKTMSHKVNEDIYKIKIKNLKDPLEITGEHPVCTLKFDTTSVFRQWIKAKDLKKGDFVCVMENKLDDNVHLPITKISQSNFEGTVYNFEVEGDNSYVANGIVVHNCITAKEAQLSATPIVCSNIAALQTTVGEYGHIIHQHPYSYEGRLECIEQIVKLHKDKDYWLEMSQRSLRGAKNISWDDRWKDYWSKWL